MNIPFMHSKVQEYFMTSQILIDSTRLLDLPGIQDNVFHGSPPIRVGDVHSAIGGLDNGRIGVFSLGTLQSEHLPPIFTVFRNCDVQHIAPGRKSFAANRVIVNQ
jgi:hypothetical protein